MRGHVLVSPLTALRERLFANGIDPPTSRFRAIKKGSGPRGSHGRASFNPPPEPDIAVSSAIMASSNLNTLSSE